MSKLWRCVNPDCSSDPDVPGRDADFEAAEGECPKCRRSGPAAVVEVARVCLLVFAGDGPIRTPHGGRRVACKPDARRHPRYATGEPAAVSCPACKATDDFARLSAPDAGPQDVPIVKIGG